MKGGRQRVSVSYSEKNSSDDDSSDREKPTSKKSLGAKDMKKSTRRVVESSDDNKSDGEIEDDMDADADESDQGEVAESMRKVKPATVKKSKKSSSSNNIRSRVQQATDSTPAPIRVSTRQARIENNLMNDVHKRISKMPAAVFFMVAVDPVELEIPDYFDIIDKPMDLGTIKQKLSNLAYEAVGAEGVMSSYEAFGEDMRLTFVNAYTYNHMEDNPVHIAGKELEAAFDIEFARLTKTILQQREENADATNAAMTASLSASGHSTSTSRSSFSKKGDGETKLGDKRKGRFTEAESDDEFAIENFTFANSDTKNKNKGKSNSKGKDKCQSMDEKAEAEANMDTGDSASDHSASASVSDDSNSDDDDDEDKFEYRVQHVLASKTMTAAEWRDVCDHMNTREITRGSAWKQPDEEYFDNSKYIVTKYLIKWMHASYLHVSWETEKDLLDCVGTSAKTQLKKFHIRIALGQELFEDLGRGEFYLPSFTTVERFLDVDDPRVDILKVDWENAPLPEFDPLEEQENSDDEDDEEVKEEADAQVQGQVQVQELEQLNESSDMNVQMDGMADGNEDLLDFELSNSCLFPPPSEYLALPTTAVDGSNALISPSKKDSTDLKELLGSIEFTSPANLAAIAQDTQEGECEEEERPFAAAMMDDDDDDLFDSDEEREIEARVRAQAIAKEGEEQEQEQGQGQVSSRRSGRARRGVEHLIEANEGDEEIAPRRRGRNVTKATEPDAKALEAKKAKAFKTMLAREPPCTELHGSGKGAIWVTVKWEGLPYSDSSFEDLRDLQRMYIEYESPMRSFFKREQLIPTKGTTRVKRALVASAMEKVNGPLQKGNLELRDYQWEGVRWLLFNWSQRRNSILADEMGLGKTIQSAVFLQMLHREQGMRGPFLIVAPLSTVVQWQREITLWTDLDAIIYHGSVEDREVIRTHEFAYMSRKGEKGTKLQVVITTPETCMSADSKTPTARVRRELSKIKWDLVIVDEAHKLKNYDSKVGNLLRDEFDYLNTILLTGTPLQNNTDELWTLLNFVNRDEFSDREAFCKEFGSMQDSEQLQRLHARLKPYLLRREKEHVEKKVPPKEEMIVEVELTTAQKQYYRAIYEQKTGFLYKKGAKDGPSLSNLAMELRKCCNHPFLIKGAEAELSKHFEGDSPVDQVVKSSGKMMLLDKLLPKLKADGHRVLIFSQFRIMLNIIEDYMIMRGYSFERIDGAITGRKRQNAIDRYTQPSEEGKESIFAMLLSTRAGGVGINLTAADTVIIFDSDWNPQNDIQAQARAHRIGQQKKVKVYRFITRKSYETAMFQAASIKLGLDYAVMGGMRPNQIANGLADGTADNFSNLSKKELENLLKHGAYDIFSEEKDGSGVQASQKFAEEGIDSILERSSVVVHGKKGGDDEGVGINSSSGDGEHVKEKSSASFSKASFVSGTGADDVAMDDPDFWSKVVGLAEGATAEETSNRGSRRCRDHVESYKEPGMTFTIFESDSESDSDIEGQQRVNSKRADFDVTAEWTESNMSRLLQSLCSQGYGNWSAIRASTKLRWSHKDLALASRAIILQLVCWASLDNDPQEKYWKGYKCPEGLKKAQWGYEDLQFVEDFLGRNRACRLALAASLRDSHTHESTQEHSCKTVQELYDACSKLPVALYFRKAVDPVALDIPDYFDIVKKPMDMGLIKQNMLRGHYEGDHNSFAVHMRLTFFNAYTYNHMEDNVVHMAAKSMEAAFNEKYAAFLAYLASEPTEDVLLAEAYDLTVQAVKGGMEESHVQGEHSKIELFDFFDNAGVLLSSTGLLYGDDDVTPVILVKEDLMGMDEDEQRETRNGVAMENSAKEQRRFSRLRSMIITSRCAPQLSDFNLWENGKNSQIRSQARGKLRAIEDLFECRLMSTVATGKRWAADRCAKVLKTEVEIVEHESKAEAEAEAEETEAEKEVKIAALDAVAEQTINANTFVALAAIAARLSECKHLESAHGDVPGWDCTFDAWLVLTVNTLGWPEGKRKQAALQSRWEDYMKTRSLVSSPVPVSVSVPVPAPVLTSIKPEQEQEQEQKQEQEHEQEIRKVDVIPTNMSVSAAFVRFPEDLMKGKFPSRRCKEIGLALRGGSEAAAAAAAKEAAKAEAAAQRAAAAAEKAAAKASKAAAQLPKQIFAAMQRVGRPREGYVELLALLSATAATVSSSSTTDSMEVIDVTPESVIIREANSLSVPLPGSTGRHQYILTWEALALDVGMTSPISQVDMKLLQSIVKSIVDTAYTVIDPTTASQEINEDGHVLSGSGLTPKALFAAMEKIDTIHRLRLACSCLDSDSIRSGIASTCKQAGPLVGPARRDTTLPAWWNVEHDLSLLRLCFSSHIGGYGQWKKMCGEKMISDAPIDFIMPSKMQGFDWVTTLTPKVCEKRLIALASGLTRYMATLPVGTRGYVPAPPGSPERKNPNMGGNSNKSRKLGSGTGVSGSSSAAPLVTKLENYQRPSWIQAFNTTKDTVQKPETTFAGAAMLRNIAAGGSTATATATATATTATATATATTATVTVTVTAPKMTIVPLVGLSPVASPLKAARRVPDAALSQQAQKGSLARDSLQTVASASASASASVPAVIEFSAGKDEAKKPVLASTTASAWMNASAVLASATPPVASTTIPSLAAAMAIANQDVVILDNADSDMEQEVVDVNDDGNVDATPFKKDEDKTMESANRAQAAVTPSELDGLNLNFNPNDGANAFSGEKKRKSPKDKNTDIKRTKKEKDLKEPKEPKEPKVNKVSAKKEKPVCNIMNFFGAPKPSAETVLPVD